jgi:hypothetical protein
MASLGVKWVIPGLSLVIRDLAIKVQGVDENAPSFGGFRFVLWVKPKALVKKLFG